ncbi:flavin reductase [Clostridium sp. BL-8]|uniref:flavin reductase n=1 Tax=Clostridium sp. BL-8 TaxID=349938 RepID=UPI00098C5819|nr:flavin reductase [Clostridium sp. BL-8]OOM81465.1 flavin reductase like domain protein [Clostridium sp. BL-8]
MNFEEIDLTTFDFNPFTKVEDWALLTAGTENKFNMMTVTGVMCGKFFLKPMMQVYVHPDRYSYQFLKNNDYFTVSFFDVPRHPALQVCGTLHGNECNKVAESGLHPIPFENTVIFEEAKIIFVCKKVYHTDVDKDNFDSQQLFNEYYKDSSTFHRIYLGQIEKVLCHK